MSATAGPARTCSEHTRNEELVWSIIRCIVAGLSHRHYCYPAILPPSPTPSPSPPYLPLSISAYAACSLRDDSDDVAGCHGRPIRCRAPQGAKNAGRPAGAVDNKRLLLADGTPRPFLPVDVIRGAEEAGWARAIPALDRGNTHTTHTVSFYCRPITGPDFRKATERGFSV